MNRKETKDLSRRIRTAIAGLISNKESFIDLNVEKIQALDENEMEWTPSQPNEEPTTVSLQDFKELNKKFEEIQEAVNYWRERCQKAEQEIASLQKFRSVSKKERENNEKIGEEIWAIYKRGEKNSVTASMNQLILSLLIRGHLSTRQIELSMQLLLEKIPSLSTSLIPSQTSISRAINLLPNVNLIQGVHFLNASQVLSLAFDETYKCGRNVHATILINEVQGSFVISAEQCDGTSASTIAKQIMESLARVAVSAKDHELIEGDHLIWLETQLRKIHSLVSDSCPTAKKTRQLLEKELKDALDTQFGNPDHRLDHIDCSMHVISNMERKMKEALRSSAAKALSIVSQNLANDFSRLRADWNNTHETRYISEVGSRFEQTSQNALRIIQGWDDLIAFSALRPDNIKMQELHHLLTNCVNEVKADLLAFASTWYVIILPTWNSLKTADGRRSVQLMKSMREKMKQIISGADRSSIMKAQSAACGTEIAEFLTSLLSNTLPALNDGLKRCAEAALAYQDKVVASWTVVDHFTDETLIMPFTNQRV